MDNYKKNQRFLIVSLIGFVITIFGLFAKNYLFISVGLIIIIGLFAKKYILIPYNLSKK